MYVNAVHLIILLAFLAIAAETNLSSGEINPRSNDGYDLKMWKLTRTSRDSNRLTSGKQPWRESDGSVAKSARGSQRGEV